MNNIYFVLFSSFEIKTTGTITHKFQKFLGNQNNPLEAEYPFETVDIAIGCTNQTDNKSLRPTTFSGDVLISKLQKKTASRRSTVES